MMTTLGTSGMMISAVWVALVALKLNFLLWIFRLKVSATMIVIPILAAAGVAFFPYALPAYKGAALWIHLGATWYGVLLGAGAFSLRTRVESTVQLDDRALTVLRRIRTAAMFLWAGFYMFHTAIWMVTFDIPLTLAHASPLFTLCLLLKREVWTWAGSFSVVAMTTVLPPSVTPAAFILAILLGIKAWRTGPNRYYSGAIICLYIGFCSMGWEGGKLPDPHLGLLIPTTVALLSAAWFLRLPSAIPAAIMVMLSGSKVFLPRGLIQWGSFILIIGFTTLIAGFLLNWHQMRFQSHTDKGSSGTSF
jgi:hypothetical protein